MSEFTSIENLIGYTFKNKNLLNQALTHPSYSTSQFQVFEFLGDRVLGMVMADIVFRNQKDIKHIANEFANLVNTDALVQVTKVWKVEEFFNHDIENISSKVLADVVEAIIAAIYLDSNFKTVYRILENLYKTTLEGLKNNIVPKTYLQELCQSKSLKLPKYVVKNIEGEDHKKVYTIEVSVKNLGSAIGKGASKHEASKIAAKNLIELLKK